MPKRTIAGRRAKPADNGLIHVTRIPTLPKRPRDAHKGTFGRVLVIAGSREMLGAACLTTQAALKSGAGLVTLACPESIQRHAAANCICATTIPLPETKNGMIDPDRAIRLFESRGFFDPQKSPSVIAAGPGIGQSDLSFARSWIDLIREFDRAGRAPIVLDADGLNALALACKPVDGFVRWPFSSNFILTPHPGEMGRLCGDTADSVQKDREAFALAAARKMNERASIPFHANANANAAAPGVIVLKGAGTLVTDGRRLYENATGNPGMATGGTGDVLTGMIAGLIALGLSRFDAAALGTYLHGLAGDIVAYSHSETGLTASDVCEHISFLYDEEQRKMAVKELRKRTRRSAW